MPGYHRTQSVLSRNSWKLTRNTHYGINNNFLSVIMRRLRDR